MICVELDDILEPEKTIIISSAKCRDELPARYKFQHTLPLYKIIPSAFLLEGAKILQPIVEPDRNKNKETFRSMLGDKQGIYMKRTIKLIMEWERKDYPDHIYHIHGDQDHTIPIENVDYDYLVKGGSHMMVLTRAEMINSLIQKILAEE